MERIERISNKHEQEERKEKGERERATKGQGKEKENLSFLCFCSRRFPCHALGPFNYRSLTACWRVAFTKGPGATFGYRLVSVGVSVGKA